MKPYSLQVFLAIVGLGISAAGTLSLPWILKEAIDGPLSSGVPSPQAWSALNSAGIKYLGILLVTMSASFLQIYLLAFVGQKVMVELRTRLFDHFLKKPLKYHQNEPVGKLVSAVTGDVGTIAEFFNTLFTSLLKDLVVMIGVVVTLFTLNPTLGTFTVATLIPVIFLIVFFRWKSRKAYRRTRAAFARVHSFLSEYIGGMSIVQLFSRESQARKDFSQENQELLKSNLGEMYVNAIFRPLIDLLSAFSLGVLLWFGTGMVLENVLTLGVLIAFINLLNQFYQPVGSLAENFSALQSALSGSERVFGYLDQSETIPDLGVKTLPESQELPLEFKDVYFSYNPEEPVLRGLSFSVNPGETVALVGYTGAGKTTVTSLLTRFWDVQQGSLQVSGVDIQDYSLKSVREGIQSVLQDVILFSGTVRENITLGKQVSHERLEEVCRKVKALDFIEGLPKKWETELGEGATQISAGQRQLISFARVLIQNPKILILDEATANIDTETELKIQEALKELLKGRTSLVIAHRLSTIRHADKIVVLDRGVTKEEGTHDQLMKLQGFYYNLYKLQYEKSQA